MAAICFFFIYISYLFDDALQLGSNKRRNSSSDGEIVARHLSLAGCPIMDKGVFAVRFHRLSREKTRVISTNDKCLSVRRLVCSPEVAELCLLLLVLIK